MSAVSDIDDVDASVFVPDVEVVVEGVSCVGEWLVQRFFIERRERPFESVAVVLVPREYSSFAGPCDDDFLNKGWHRGEVSGIVVLVWPVPNFGAVVSVNCEESVVVGSEEQDFAFFVDGDSASDGALGVESP